MSELEFCVVCFVFGFVVIGAPLGMFLGTRMADRQVRTEHGLEGGVPVQKDRPPQRSVFHRLLLQEIKLLFQELLLKVKSQATGQQRADEDAEHATASASKESVVVHKRRQP